MLNFFKKQITGRSFGKLAPYSISSDGCFYNWQTSPALELTARAKIPGFDKLMFISAKTNPVRSDSFIRIFIYENSSNKENFHLTFDITTADNMNTDVIMISDKKFSASRTCGVEKNNLNDDKYHENILVHPEAFEMVFELYISNNDDPSKDKIVKDFLIIVNSLKI